MTGSDHDASANQIQMSNTDITIERLAERLDEQQRTLAQVLEALTRTTAALHLVPPPPLGGGTGY